MIEPILNRWRGTGDIVTISKLRITGTMIYALYLGALFGLVTQSYAVSAITLIGFLAGESFGWGKWVGTLVTDEPKDLEKEYADKEGYNFPYIHYIANAIQPERENFRRYCTVALGIRGAVWAMFLYIGLIGLGYIAWYDYFVVILAYGIGFPLASWLGKEYIINKEYKHLSMKDAWESQEIYYGVIHGLCNMYLVYTIIN